MQGYIAAPGSATYVMRALVGVPLKSFGAASLDRTIGRPYVFEVTISDDLVRVERLPDGWTPGSVTCKAS